MWGVTEQQLHALHVVVLESQGFNFAKFQTIFAQKSRTLSFGPYIWKGGVLTDVLNSKFKKLKHDFL